MPLIQSGVTNYSEVFFTRDTFILCYDDGSNHRLEFARRISRILLSNVFPSSENGCHNSATTSSSSLSWCLLNAQGTVGCSMDRIQAFIFFDFMSLFWFCCAFVGSFGKSTLSFLYQFWSRRLACAMRACVRHA